MANSQDLLNRLASAHGHLAGVRNMAARGEPCPQLILQLRAVQGALCKIEQQLIKQHLYTCLQCSDKSATELEADIFELFTLSAVPGGAQPTGVTETLLPASTTYERKLPPRDLKE